MIVMDPVASNNSLPTTVNSSTLPTNSATMNDTSSGEVVVPEEIKGWSWAAFLWTWVWAIGNKAWVGLLALLPIPFANLIMAIILGVNGNKWAWKNKKWESVEVFKKTQHKWVKWWLIINIPLAILAIIGLILSFLLSPVNPQEQVRLVNCVESCQPDNNYQSCVAECQNNTKN